MTRRQFFILLRANGWRRPYNNAGYYEHANGGAFHHDTMTDGVTWWRAFAHSGLLPDSRIVYRHDVAWGGKSR